MGQRPLRPLVGILSSWREPGEIPLPLHATAATYVAAVRSFAGAETVLIPGSEDPEQANSLLPRLDGIVLTGGALRRMDGGLVGNLTIETIRQFKFDIAVIGCSAMDADGYIWNARWGGSCLIRFAPDGSVDRIVELPVTQPTSCVFGGPDLKTLYITSAAVGLEDNGNPLEGALLSIRTEVAGQLCHPFAG